MNTRACSHLRLKPSAPTGQSGSMGMHTVAKNMEKLIIHPYSCPGGESVDEMEKRVDGVIASVRTRVYNSPMSAHAQG